MYGLVGKRNHLKSICKEVCECLGYGSNYTADDLLYETCGAETHFGEYKDTTEFAGMGITQFDKLPFKDIKDRTRQKYKDKVLKYFDIDINYVEWEDLRYNPLLAVIFTRLKYKLVPEAVPRSIEDRAKYYKIHYNSMIGKSSVKKYLEINGYDMKKYDKSMEV